jgi:hypothetical protein
MESYSLELVEWMDTISVDGWIDLQEAAECRPVRVQSVGFVLEVTSEYLKLAGSLVIDEQQDISLTGAVWTIPIGMVINRYEL